MSEDSSWKSNRFLQTVVAGVVATVVGGLVLAGLSSGSSSQTDRSSSGDSSLPPSPSVVTDGSPSAPSSSTPDTSSPASSPASEPSPTPLREAVPLASLKPVRGWIDRQPAGLGGRTYLDLVRQDPFVCGKDQVVYNLANDYSEFSAKAGLDDTYASGRPWIFAVYATDADGDHQLFKRVMTIGQVTPIKVSVEGALHLKLTVEWIDAGRGSDTCSPMNSWTAVWAKPTLTPAP